MSLAGCQIDVSCYLKKVWKFLIQIQLTKSDPKKDKEIKVSPLMPIRVKAPQNFIVLEALEAKKKG